ncbi:hypothetical protein HYY75_01800, partial [bacterium]|nr:hypothetical protein [bacterium]
SGLLILIFLRGKAEVVGLVQEERRFAWECEAKEILSFLRSSHTVESQIETMGRQMQDFIKNFLANSKSRTPGISGKLIKLAFLKSFPLSHRPNGTLSYAYLIAGNNEVISMRGNGLATLNNRIIGNLMKDFILISEKGAIPTFGYEAVVSRTKGVFGEEADVRLFALEGRGRLIPANFRERRVFLLWDIITFEKKNLGCYLNIFPADLELSAKPLQFALKTVYKAHGKKFFPVLVPIPSSRNSEPIYASSFKVAGSFRPIFSELFSIKDREQKIPSSSHLKLKGFWLIRDFFSYDHPFESWVFSKSRGKENPHETIPERFLIWAFFF